jgi:hypothetical protein
MIISKYKAIDKYVTSYPHDSALTKRFVEKITVERCNEFLVAVPQIFDRVKSIAFVNCISM